MVDETSVLSRRGVHNDRCENMVHNEWPGSFIRIHEDVNNYETICWDVKDELQVSKQPTRMQVHAAI